MFGFATEFRKKYWVNTHAEQEACMQNLQLNACFKKKFSIIIKVFVKNAPRF